jgi:phage terminase Nu1 subunit (DNA packaging protein)
MPSKSGRIVNKKELAQIFGVSPQAVDGWLGRGLPFIKKGSALQGYEFDTSSAIAWKAQREVEAAFSEKGGEQTDDFKRKLAAEANIAELKFARDAGQLITIEEAEEEWAPKIASCRARLLAIPSKVAVPAYAADSAEEVQSLVQDAVYEALNELADGEEELSEPPDRDSGVAELDPEDGSDL